MSLTRIDLEFPFGDTSARLHCPACGAEIIGGEEFGSCEHLLFLFCGMAGLFDSIDPALEADVDLAAEEQDDAFCPVELAFALLERSPTEGLVAISHTTGGMACGPVWETNWAAFSLLGQPYASPSEQEQEA